MPQLELDSGNAKKKVDLMKHSHVSGSCTLPLKFLCKTKACNFIKKKKKLHRLLHMLFSFKVDACKKSVLH